MRATLERISPVLVAAVLAGGFVVSSALPAGADTGDERRDRLHAERPIAAATSNPVFIHPDMAAQIEEAEFLQGVAPSASGTPASRGPRPKPRPRPPPAAGAGAPPPSARPVGSCNGDVACFLECTKAHESDTSGGYGAVSSGGTYRGAYQFAQRTWDAAVAGAGHEEYAGMPADAGAGRGPGRRRGAPVLGVGHPAVGRPLLADAATIAP